MEKFAYRFSGHPVRGKYAFYIVGVGLMEMDQQGSITGRQTSTLTQFGGVDAELQSHDFTLEGELTWNGDMGSAEIRFSHPDQQLTGRFAVVRAGADRLWLVSTATILQTTGGPRPVNEIVSGEAIRLTP